LAREFRGLTQTALGEEVAASYALISLYENGKKRNPTPDFVEACSAVLGFELGFFYSPIEDLFVEEQCSFRHRRSTPERLKTQIRAHATLIGMVIAELRQLFKFPVLSVPHIPASSDNEIEEAAEETRRIWNIALDSPIKQVGRALERAGVFIIPHLGASAKVDAFSRHGQTAVIFLNKTIPSTSRWIFDIAHECGHLVMHPDIPTGSLETEAEANRFASAFLMPRKAFSREFRMSPFSWTHVFELKKRWMASAGAIIRRSYDLGLIGAVDYRQAFKYMSAKGWTKGEPYEPTFQEPELLITSLQSLGPKVGTTVESLCQRLHFAPGTFQEITGFAVPEGKRRPVDVIPFRLA
jgi:Zn-dependent peptidase ImmA (M78 family)